VHAVAFVGGPTASVGLGVVVPAGWGYEKGAVTLDAEGQTAADVMARYCAGDVTAFQKLYGLLAPRILAYLRGLLMGDQAAAEDMLQLTFLKVHEARDTYVRGANPIPWIYTIAHRTTLDELRKRKRSRVRLTKDGEVGGAGSEPAAAISGAASDSEHEVDREAIAGALAALEHLPANQREALLLTKVHGRSHAEAAQITGTTPGAIKLRAHRAYVTLRQLLGKKPGAEARQPTASGGVAAKAAEKELG
jgi:RNA polymerase sigma-70 factor (ECF subfamily)